MIKLSRTVDKPTLAKDSKTFHSLLKNELPQNDNQFF